MTPPGNASGLVGRRRGRAGRSAGYDPGMRSFAAVVLLSLATSPALLGQRTGFAALSGAGWDALNAGRVPEAAAAFDAALRVSPQQPSVLLGAGIAAHLQGREDEARRLLVDALRSSPP